MPRSRRGRRRAVQRNIAISANAVSRSSAPDGSGTFCVVPALGRSRWGYQSAHESAAGRAEIAPVIRETGQGTAHRCVVAAGHARGRISYWRAAARCCGRR